MKLVDPLSNVWFDMWFERKVMGVRLHDAYLAGARTVMGESLAELIDSSERARAEAESAEAEAEAEAEDEVEDSGRNEVESDEVDMEEV